MKLRVNKLIWTIQAVPRNSEKLKIDDHSCFGVTCYAELRIYLDKNQSRELFRQTVIHELVHVFSFSFGVHLVANEKTEEPVCDFMGAHLDEIHDAADRIMDSCYGKKEAAHNA
ncbi:MAG: hypothetical protein K2N94_12120 [Lachnospiraceae bacterium]|nr:hypothetical protein [Lachnospiraceae bacterium]